MNTNFSRRGQGVKKFWLEIIYDWKLKKEKMGPSRNPKKRVEGQIYNVQIIK